MSVDSSWQPGDSPKSPLRLAIALWQAKLHGRQPECIRVDEGFDALDGANALRMVELMKSLGDLLATAGLPDEGE